MPLPKISVRLPVALQAALSDHVRQHGGQVSDILRDALEAYLGLCPTDRPTAGPTTSPTGPTLSDTVRDLAGRLTALADLQTRVDSLEAQAPQASAVRPSPTGSRTEGPTQECAPPRHVAGDRC